MEFEVYRYKLPFKTPFIMSQREYDFREGALVALSCNGQKFWSEAAPLVGFSTETLDDSLTQLTDHALVRRWITGNAECGPGCHPSVKFALSMLRVQNDAGKAGNTITKHITENDPGPIKINATIGIDEEEKVLKMVQDFADQGFRTVKFKVGRDFDKEVKILFSVRRHFPDLNLRIDANQAWDVKEAHKNLSRLHVLGLEYCEQPIEQKRLEELIWLKNQISLDIAADEAVRSFQDARKLVMNKSVDILVLKPMLIGSLTAFLDILELSKQFGVSVVVTTLFESGIGRQHVARLAGMVKHSTLAHGLSTGNLFSGDVYSDSHLIKDGMYHMNLADRAAQPDISQLEKVDSFTISE